MSTMMMLLLYSIVIHMQSESRVREVSWNVKNEALRRTNETKSMLSNWSMELEFSLYYEYYDRSYKHN